MDNSILSEKKEILSITEKGRESIEKEGTKDVQIPAGAIIK